MTLTTEQIKKISDVVSEEIPNIKKEAIWMIEDLLYKSLGKDVLNQDERILLSAKILSNCINMSMSISDDWAAMHSEIQRLTKEFLNSAWYKIK